MSHKLEISTAQTEKEGFVVIKDTATIKAVDILDKTCKALRLTRPVYEPNMKVQGQPAPGYAIRLIGTVVDPKKPWNQPVSVNTETGTLAFDNYSPYGPDHRDVIAGKRRVGEEGKWGDIAKLDEFRKEYEHQLNSHLCGLQQQIASQQGHYARIVENNTDRIVLEVEA